LPKPSGFTKRKNDAYDTWDARAMPPLLPHLFGRRFVEPCAGRGALIDLCERQGLQCVAAYDIAPRRDDIEVADAGTVRLPPCDQVITNTPWTRRLMVAILANLADQAMTFALLDHAWACNKGAALLKRCHKIIAVGRLQWVEDTEHDHTADCAWYLFGPNPPPHPLFIGRA
jgi:hypothetical protein